MQNVAIISCNEIVYLPVDKIRLNPYQPRKNFDKVPLEELAKSIKQYGVMQPISVRFINGVSYELVAGERRLRACKLAGIDTIPTIIVNISDKDSAAIALIENMQRENLNFLEEAEGFQNLMSDFSYTQEELAHILGKSQSTIANKLRLLRLDKEVKKMLVENLLTERHARALLKIDDEQLQKEVLNKVVRYGLNVKRTENLIESVLANNDTLNDDNYIDANNDKKSNIKVKRYFKDVRLFTNTIKQAVKLMNDSGVATNYVVKQNEDGVYEINIKLNVEK